jgi:hypothetical protein
MSGIHEPMFKVNFCSGDNLPQMPGKGALGSILLTLAWSLPGSRKAFPVEMDRSKCTGIG